jgi:hypothetical protein
MTPQAPPMFDILRELLLQPNFNNKASVTTFVRATVSSLESSLISSGTCTHLCVGAV